MKDPIDLAASNISLLIKKINPEETIEKDVMEYALSLLFNLVLTIMTILIIGYITNTFQETLISMVFFGALRTTAKGFHLKSLTACVLLTSSLVAMTPHVPIPAFYTVPIGLICIFVILIKSESKAKKKALAVAVVFVGMIAFEPYIILACAAQAITLIPKRR